MVSFAGPLSPAGVLVFSTCQLFCVASVGWMAIPPTLVLPVGPFTMQQVAKPVIRVDDPERGSLKNPFVRNSGSDVALGSSES